MNQPFDITDRDKQIVEALTAMPDELTVGETESIILSLVTALFEEDPATGPNFLFYLALKLQVVSDAMEERDFTTTH